MIFKYLSAILLIALISGFIACQPHSHTHGPAIEDPEPDAIQLTDRNESSEIFVEAPWSGLHICRVRAKKDCSAAAERRVFDAADGRV